MRSSARRKTNPRRPCLSGSKAGTWSAEIRVSISGGTCVFLPFTRCKQMSRRNACDKQSKRDSEVKVVTSAALVKGSSAEHLRKQTGSLFVFIVWEKHSVSLRSPCIKWAHRSFNETFARLIFCNRGSGYQQRSVFIFL